MTSFDGSDLNCNEVVELVTDYLEDALDAATRSAMDAHLARCDGCAIYLDQLRQTIALIGRMDRDVLPESAWVTLREALRDLPR